MKNSINQRIKHIRTVLKYSQSSFSEYLGIKQASLSDIERGKTEVNYNTLSELSIKFNVNLNWLITGMESPFIDKSDNARNILYSKIEEINLINEINANRKKVQFYCDRVIDVYELFIVVLGHNSHDAGGTERELRDELLKEDYILNEGIEYYETLDFDGKVKYNEELKKGVDYLLDSFFNKFRYIYTKLSSPDIYEIIKKNVNKVINTNEEYINNLNNK